MMSAALRYLEEAYRDRIAQEYRDKGYEVAQDVSVDGVQLDLVVTKNGRTVIYAVKAQASLREAAEEVRRQRTYAYEHGYEFGLAVANPPRATTVKIEGLEATLRDQMVKTQPVQLAAISTTMEIEKVSQIHAEAITITHDSIQIRGEGVVVVTFIYDGEDWWDDYPFTFDILLDHALRLVAVHDLRVKTAHFHDLIARAAALASD
jgi:hypothetical protein